MKQIFFKPKYLFFLLVFNLFLLLAAGAAAAMGGLLVLVGDFASARIFGWTAAGMGLLFVASFFLLVFVHIGTSLFASLLQDGEGNLFAEPQTLLSADLPAESEEAQAKEEIHSETVLASESEAREQVL